MSRSIADGARRSGRRMEGSRLAYYETAPDSAFWDRLWATAESPEALAPFARGELYHFEAPFTAALPKDGRILEAGCGTGQWVVALRARGYRCFGIDFARDALQRARRRTPSLPLLVGDVGRMPLPASSIDAVISLGVVEHRQAGPEPWLDELRRIVRPGGRLLISVPYLNALRRRRARQGWYRDATDGLAFYQYAFAPDEFQALLRRAGFEPERLVGYDHRKCLRQEVPWLQRLPGPLSRVVFKLSDYVPGVSSRLGHMLLVVARRRPEQG
jgi:SAM-dependent methyltransferase